MNQVLCDGSGIRLLGNLDLDTVGSVERRLTELFQTTPHKTFNADVSELTGLDTAGAVFLQRLPDLAGRCGKQIVLTELPDQLRGFFEFMRTPERPATVEAVQPELLERLGERLEKTFQRVAVFLYLMTDLTWSAATGLVRKSGVRRGSFVEQGWAIGSQGLPIIALILFLVGAVSALQAAAQLRKFGANIFVADLLAIGVCRELGPLMTAIIVSGRSGSAIAAEVATMKFTEELDALQTMALDPLRFVAVPKLWAMLICVPLLTIMANLAGIMGGTLVGVTYLEVAMGAFVNQIVEALVLKDILTGLVKSVSFAWMITIIAVYRGLAFSGGAAGVGNATTSAVVSSIFGIIILDSFWGLLFYMG